MEEERIKGTKEWRELRFVDDIFETNDIADTYSGGQEQRVEDAEFTSG